VQTTVVVRDENGAAPLRIPGYDLLRNTAIQINRMEMIANPIISGVIARIIACPVISIRRAR